MQAAANPEDAVGAVSIPERMAQQARAAIDTAEVEANAALKDLEDKAVDALDTIQAKMDEFMEQVDSGRNTVVDGIDKAIEAVEKPLKELVPKLKEQADAAMEEAFAVVEQIPEQVEAKIRALKDPFIEEVKAQAESLSTLAQEQLGGLEEQLGAAKDRLIEAASAQLDGVIERVGGLADQLIERLGEGIVILEQKFAKVYEGKPGYDDIKDELKTALEDLKAALADVLRASLDSATQTVTTIKDKAIVAVNETFDQLFETVQALPEQINASIQSIVDAVDATFDAAIADARGAAERLLESLRLKLETAVATVNESVQGIIDDGFALIHEARDLLLRAIDTLITTVRTFADNTMLKIRDAVDDMVRTSREAIELGLTKVREGIDLACEDMADDLAMQVANTREKMIREAEKQARELQVAGKEAAADARKQFVMGGYEENEGVITGIRFRGERAVEAMEAKMQEAVAEVRAQFEGQIEKYVPKFEQQGKVLIGVSKASALKIVKIVATLGPSIASDLISKGKAFVDEFTEIGGQVDTLVNEKGQAYIATCEERVLKTVEVLKTQATSFASEAENTIESLVGGMRTRFEGMVAGVSTEVRAMVDGIVALITDAVQDTETRFSVLYAESRDAVQQTVDDTREAVTDFLAEAERIFDEAVEAGKRIARQLLDELKKKALEVLKAKLDEVLKALEARYAPKLQKGLDHLAETLKGLFQKQDEAKTVAEAGVREMRGLAARRAALLIDKQGYEFEIAVAESEAVRSGLQSKLNAVDAKLGDIRAQAEVMYDKVLESWGVALDGFDALWDGATDCLEALYADALSEGRDTLTTVRDRLITEGKAIAADHDLTVEAANERFQALQDEVLATLEGHGESMRASVIDDHSLQLTEARDAMGDAIGVVERHLQAALRQLEPVADPRALLARVKDVVIPELERYLAELLQNLLECYGDRIRETVSPTLAEAMDLLTEALEGAPAAARAWAIIRDEHLPALQTRAETVLGQIDEQLQARLASAESTVEGASKTIGGSVSKRLQAQATGQMGNVRARVEAGSTQAKDGAIALLDGGAEVLAAKAESDVNPSSDLAHAASDLKLGLRADMTEAAAAGTQFNAAGAGAGKGLGETSKSADEQSKAAKDAVAKDADEMAKAGDMRGVMGEASGSLKEAQTAAVEAVEKAGAEAKAGIAESRAEAGGGAEEAPEEDAPADAAAEDTAAEDTAAEDTAAEDAADEEPADAPAAEAPAEDAPAEDAPAEGAGAADDAPADRGSPRDPAAERGRPDAEPPAAERAADAQPNRGIPDGSAGDAPAGAGRPEANADRPAVAPGGARSGDAAAAGDLPGRDGGERAARRPVDAPAADPRGPDRRGAPDARAGRADGDPPGDDQG